MQGIEKEIESHYGLEVNNLYPYKDAVILVTQNGKKALKRLPFSAERLKFVHSAKEHLVSNGFACVDRYLCTLSGDPYFIYNNSCHVVVDCPAGRESNFDNDNDVRKAAVALANLHKASRGYKAPQGCMVQDDLDKLPTFFSKRLDDMRKMKRQAQKGKGRFDQLLVRYADYFIELGERTKEELVLSGYGSVVEKTRMEQSFCHHDYTHNNIIIDGDRTTVINFEYCCHEIRVYDIANFIRRKMRKCGWNMAKAAIILNSYNSVDKLDNEELSVMKAILQFPQKFWRVANRYYNSRRSWSERNYISRLQEIVDEIEPLNEFINQYRKLYC
ncbi:MAG: CotS family spore coat protein [Bacillota bacterium]